MNWPSDVTVYRWVRDLCVVTQSMLADCALRHVGDRVSKRTAIEHMAAALRRLEADGLIRRQRRLHDERTWEYEVT